MTTDPEQLCMGCMSEIDHTGPCPHCGYDENTAEVSPLAIPAHTQLNEQYLIGRVLGQGGFGITYIGWDIRLARRVAIKEYLPGGLATRAAGTAAITLYSEQSTADFGYGLEKFLDEARLVAHFQGHPGIIGVLNFFAANGTAYMVMEYLDGVTLKEHLRQHGNKLELASAMELMTPVMDALREVHAADVLHRDVSPDNIYLTRGGLVKLLDFGAARQALRDRSQALSVILKAGYAPEEQYRRSGKQGPWTDVYAVGAVLYQLITGKIPEPAIDRLVEDELESPRALGVEVSDQVEAALIKALAVRADDRFRTMDEFLAALNGTTNAATVPVEQPHVPTKQLHDRDDQPATLEEAPAPQTAPLPPGKKLPIVPLVAGGAVVLLAVIGFLLYGPSKPKLPSSQLAGDFPTAPGPAISPTAIPTVAPTVEGSPSPGPSMPASPEATPAASPEESPSVEPSPSPAPSPGAAASPATVPPSTPRSVEAARGRIRINQSTWALASPRANAEQVTEVHSGHYVILTGLVPGYAQVHLTKLDRTAYVPYDALDLTTPINKFYPIAADAPVLSQPNRWSKRISEVHRGFQVHAIGIAPGYVKIVMRSGLEGYVSTKALRGAF